MPIRVNGKEENVKSPQYVSELLHALGYDEKFVAVAINFDCVRRRDFSTTTIREGDDIEILSPQAGG